MLLIENWESKGDYDFLIERLRANEIEVNVIGSDDLFNSLAELQAYDCVILANVPRSSGEDQKSVTNFTDAQIPDVGAKHTATGLRLSDVGRRRQLRRRRLGEH